MNSPDAKDALRAVYQARYLQRGTPYHKAALPIKTTRFNNDKKPCGQGMSRREIARGAFLIDKVLHQVADGEVVRVPSTDLYSTTGRTIYGSFASVQKPEIREMPERRPNTLNRQHPVKCEDTELVDWIKSGDFARSGVLMTPPRKKKRASGMPWQLGSMSPRSSPESESWSSSLPSTPGLSPDSSPYSTTTTPTCSTPDASEYLGPFLRRSESPADSMYGPFSLPCVSPPSGGIPEPLLQSSSEVVQCTSSSRSYTAPLFCGSTGLSTDADVGMDDFVLPMPGTCDSCQLDELFAIYMYG